MVKNKRKKFALKVQGDKVIGYCLNAKGFPVKSTKEVMTDENGILHRERIDEKRNECELLAENRGTCVIR